MGNLTRCIIAAAAAAALVTVDAGVASADVKGGSLNCQSSQRVAAYGRGTVSMSLTAGSTSGTFTRPNTAVFSAEVFGRSSVGAWRVQSPNRLVDAAGWCYQP